MFIKQKYYDDGTVTIELTDRMQAPKELALCDTCVDECDNLQDWIEENLEISGVDIVAAVEDLEARRVVDVTRFI